MEGEEGKEEKEGRKGDDLNTAESMEGEEGKEEKEGRKGDDLNTAERLFLVLIGVFMLDRKLVSRGPIRGVRVNHKVSRSANKNSGRGRVRID